MEPSPAGLWIGAETPICPPVHTAWASTGSRLGTQGEEHSLKISGKAQAPLFRTSIPVVCLRLGSSPLVPALLWVPPLTSSSSHLGDTSSPSSQAGFLMLLGVLSQAERFLCIWKPLNARAMSVLAHQPATLSGT